jgi:hypothetical protein
MTQFQFKAMFTIPSNAFRTHEESDLVGVDVSRLRLKMTFVFFWLVGFPATSVP